MCGLKPWFSTWWNPKKGALFVFRKLYFTELKKYELKRGFQTFIWQFLSKQKFLYI